MSLRIFTKLRVFPSKPVSPNVIPFRRIQIFDLPEQSSNVTMPEKPRLPVQPKTPSQFMVVKSPKTSRQIYNMMGEELTHNKLILGQFGIVAITGGQLKSNHFEMMRNVVGYNIKNKKAFAIYRVDAPYKSVTMRGIGKRLGGGKPSIDHYVTPLRSGRVIMEVGGQVLWDQVYYWLKSLADKLPFEAIPVNQSLLDRLNNEEKRLESINENPLSMEWMIRNNILDCQRHLSPYDKKHFGKFVYRDRKLNKKWNLVRQSKYTHR